MFLESRDMKNIVFKAFNLFRAKASDKPVGFFLPATRIDFKAFSELKPLAKPVQAEVENEQGSSEMQTLFRLLDNGII